MDHCDVYRSRLPEPHKEALAAEEKMMKPKLAVFSIAVMVFTAAAAYAHHSFAATYDEKQTMTIKGKMVQFSFRNPHSFVQVETTDEKGTIRWAVEWAGTAQLNNTGVQQDTLK